MPAPIPHPARLRPGRSTLRGERKLKASSGLSDPMNYTTLFRHKTVCRKKLVIFFFLCLAVFVSVQSRHRECLFRGSVVCCLRARLFHMTNQVVAVSFPFVCFFAMNLALLYVTFSPLPPVLHFAKHLFRTPCAHPFPAPKRPTTPSRHDLQDRDYTIPSLPVELQGVRLTCVQTAQGDKRAGGSRFWRLSLMQVGRGRTILCSARW